MSKEDNSVDRFISIVRKMTKKKLNETLDGAKKELSEEAYLFFEQLIFSIRENAIG